MANPQDSVPNADQIQLLCEKTIGIGQGYHSVTIALIAGPDGHDYMLATKYGESNGLVHAAGCRRCKQSNS